jgi:hypothetical protein
MVRRAAETLVEPLGIRAARTLRDVDLQQAVADQERRGDPRLDGFLVLPAHHEPVDDRVHAIERLRLGRPLAHGAHARGVRRIGFDAVGNVQRLAVDDQVAAALLANLGEEEVEILAVHLEDRGAQLDFSPLGQG